MRRAVIAVCGVLTLVGCDKKDTPTAGAQDVTPAEPATEELTAEQEPEAQLEEPDEEPGDDGVDAGETVTAEATGTAEAAPAAAGDPEPEGPPALPKPKYAKVDNSCGKDPGVGQRLKSFKLKSVQGKTMTNRTWGNKVLLVNFWGTWCKPCLKELPEFARLYRRYRKNGLVLVAIATDDDPEPVKAILQKSKISAKVAVGGEDYAGKYGSPKFPFTFVVDGSGTIKSSYRGYEPKCMGKLEADIRAELEKRNAG